MDSKVSSVQPKMIKTVMVSLDLFDKQVNDLLDKGWSIYSPITYDITIRTGTYRPGCCFVVLYK